MYKIDQETVRRILDTADIVDVVSDFVSLKRRGANYIGLCPFHNERTPSFSVSKSKGICKCFSCGKGGSPVNFIMLHEQMGYQEALRYLAKKYNIEIKEHEMTDREREEASERESLLAVNEFAMLHFEHNIVETEEGRNVGRAYFRERGISDAMIKKFRLGYAIDRRDDLISVATSRGYKTERLLQTGLAGKSERGDLYDRFRGRVIYPVFSISGKVVAFGGRVLRADKPGGKYVNSPESIIYSKSRELYGLYQAKPAIVKHDKCILVEGYMDVISMFQSGVENVVASSGTSLTDGQVRLIHRFTDNVTVIYDSDAAGIKASLRGIDMLLSEGLNVKVLLLPDGDDPDSFAQNHSSTEVEEYIKAHETDFIKFKTDILLQDAGSDPIRRSKVIGDIVRSIAVIPSEISRDLYIKECAFALDIDDRVLAHEVQKCLESIIEAEAKRRRVEQSRAAAAKAPCNDISAAADAVKSPAGEQLAVEQPSQQSEQQPEEVYTVTTGIGEVNTQASALAPYEREIVRYVVKYGMKPLDEPIPGENDEAPFRVIDFISEELATDNITLVNPDYAHLFSMAMALCDTWDADYATFKAQSEALKNEEWSAGIEQIRAEAGNLNDISLREQQLKDRVEEAHLARLNDYATNYIERILSSSSDDIARELTIDLVTDRHILSKIHTKYAHIEEEKDILGRLVPRAVYELRNAILQQEINSVNQRLKKAYSENPDDFGEIENLMKLLSRMKGLSAEFAKLMGDRVIMPPKRRR